LVARRIPGTEFTEFKGSPISRPLSTARNLPWAEPIRLGQDNRLVDAPVFSSVMLLLGEAHQSPIRIKALMSGTDPVVLTAPGSHAAPENYQYPYDGQVLGRTDPRAITVVMPTPC